ncbi:MAG: butyrate kinase [Bacillota bacterium]
MEKLLVINPGSTSTKLAVFRGEEEDWSTSLNHSREELQKYDNVADQLSWRKEVIEAACQEAGYAIDDFAFFVARGGLLDPLPGGTYLIDEDIVADLKAGKNGEHASNLAAVIAYEFGETVDKPAYTVDPVAVDEFEPVARLSGHPDLPRRCQSHALNLKAVSRKVADKLEVTFTESNQIGVHLGGGISIAAMHKGRIIDVNNANQGGPYSPERTGTLPALDLVEYIYQEEPELAQLKKEINGRGGLMAYLGTADGQEVESRIEAGDEEAEKVYNGMVYQIAKEVGAMAAVLNGEVHGIFLTGGLANSEYLTRAISDMVDFIAPVFIFPGAEEMEHLAKGGLRVFQGDEEPKVYAAEKLT